MASLGIPIAEQKVIKAKTSKPLLFLGIAAMTMAFAGLVSAYVVSQAKSSWAVFELPEIFTYSTAVIILSSITMIWAVFSAKSNKSKSVTIGVVSSLVLGIVFAILQFQAWGTMIEKEIYFTGPGSNVSGSFLFVLTAFHLAHLTAGLIVLGVTTINSIKGKYNSENLLGIELSSIFWHFLTILWVFLYYFLITLR